jgi:hypothetical protein
MVPPGSHCPGLYGNQIHRAYALKKVSINGEWLKSKRTKHQMRGFDDSGHNISKVMFFV